MELIHYYEDLNTLHVGTEKPRCYYLPKNADGYENLAYVPMEEPSCWRAKAHNIELVPSDGIYVALDYKQSGIGLNSCGPRLAEKYQFREAQIEWALAFHF